MPKSAGTIAEGLKPIEPPHDGAEYFFDDALADRASARSRMLHAVAPQRPWVTHYAPGTAHAPHHAPAEWIAKFKGRFDQGWDAVRVDGKPAGTVALARTLAFRMSLDETLDCGEDTGTPVSEDYRVPFAFTGSIDRVAIRLGDAKLSAAEQREYDAIRGRGVMAE